MSLDKFEIWVHDHVLKNDKIRHFVYGIYQRVLYLISPKIKCVGDIDTITPDDNFEYLFGYYDKCPWSDDGKYILALRVKNATKQADSSDPADIVKINVETKEVAFLATTHCWNVQQGCMTQWISNDQILYNDFRDGKYCSIILNILTNTERVISMPVYSVSSDRKIALSLDFSRLHRLRPGYGYCNLPDSSAKEMCPDKTCIWKIDIETGDVSPLLKYTDFSSFDPKESMLDAEHKVNHLMISPSGKRFMVLHRWFKNGVKYTRLVTCNIDGTELYNLSDDDFVSHCCWKNDEEILSYLNKQDGGKGYYLLKDKTNQYNRCWKQLSMDGHPSYSYDGQFVVTDTYPNRKRIQSLYIMNGKKVVRIAQVFSPFKYGLDTRCDLHPRWSRDGKDICFDASFGGKRSICVVDTSYLYNSTSICKTCKSGIPKVSVIIPCFNCADYISETLESLVNQTFKDFEVICINDGSSDNTLSVLNKWKDSNELNIVILDQVNSGVSTARNKGIDNASGEFILFLDSDDCYHERFIELMLSGVVDGKSDVSYCRLSRNYDDVMTLIPEHFNGVIQSQKEAMNNLLYRMGEFGFCNYIFRKDYLIKLNLRFDVDTKFGEDREFNWKYLCNCSLCYFIDIPLYWYRVNAVSATKSKASWRKTDLLRAVNRIEEYLIEHNCEFSEEFNSYMYARSMWAVAKTFAVSGDKNLFYKLDNEFPVKTCMKRTSKDSNILVAFSSFLYLINPFLFYITVRLKK